MPRITAGKVKGFKLKVAEGTTRPITDRIKISLFDTLSPVLSDAKVLDLFAGSGSIGLEAISRGASSAVLVEQNYDAMMLIKDNAQKSKLDKYIEIVNTDVKSYLGTTKKSFDIIFIDPPFALERNKKLKYLKPCIPVLNNQGYVVFRYPAEEKYPKEVKDATEIYIKKYGVSKISIYQRISEQEVTNSNDM